ncbi:MAG TPA: von Willebrand factor type A domain-containing protein [Candidatus Krumholzibacteria bacterium]
MRYAILVLLLALSGGAPAGEPPFGGMGKVQGRVTKADGNPLAYANVILVGTTMGAMTTQDGRFAIMNVPAGTYTLRAMMMGFKALEKDSVVVTAGTTVEVDFKMMVTVVSKTQEIVVTADRALVEVTESKTSAAVKSGEDMHVRGGRSSEVRVQIKGVPQAQSLGAGQVDAGNARAPWRFAPPTDREQYEQLPENDFLSVIDNPLSTFSIDVDRASYANARRFIRSGQRPPASAIRIEEFINYFDYDYPEPSGSDPFSITTEIAGCPWTPEHRLVRIGLHGRSMETEDLPPSNLVFLLDVSGSMQPENKLPLIRTAFPLLVRQLRKQDRVAIVVYAGHSGLVLDSTPGDKKSRILDAIQRLEAGGSTAGGEGLVLAYKVAREHFMKKGNNRVILATDGDFNVGVTSDGELVSLIEKERESGVFLTVLGVGDGNLQDAKMEKLADHGNGNYAYLDDIFEAQKVFVRELSGTIVTIAKDVKIQVEFNPARVASYRLIGYENRMLKKEDFEDDTRDAGELGAGHTVTALYEIEPATHVASSEPRRLRYTETRMRDDASRQSEALTVRLRYKEPDGKTSRELERTAIDAGIAFDAAATDTRFAAAVAELGMLLRGSKLKGNATLEHVIDTARAAKGADPNGYRAEFVQLAETCRGLVPEISKEE